jgi:hypothetical protein
MKVKKTNQSQNLIINLKFLQTKNYFAYNLKFKNIQSKFIKGLKIVYKYNIYNKKIFFLNVCSTIAVIIKHLIKKTKHKYIPNFILLNSDFKKNLIYKSNLLVLLNTKTS